MSNVIRVYISRLLANQKRESAQEHGINPYIQHALGHFSPENSQNSQKVFLITILTCRVQYRVIMYHDISRLYRYVVPGLNYSIVSVSSSETKYNGQTYGALIY